VRKPRVYGEWKRTGKKSRKKVKLGGVDEWVGTDVEISDEQNSVVVL